MMRVSIGLLLLTVLSNSSFTPVQQPARPSRGLERHWKETDSETLWMSRYNNCDYGYYVLLDAGVVAHNTLPPSPNHGFLIPLPYVGRTSYALDEKKRFVWVDASYGSSDEQSLTSAADGSQKLDKANGTSPHSNRTSTKLAGLPAIENTLEDSTPKGESFEQSIVAVRSGIVYTIGMRTLKAYRAADEKEFRRIRDGFRLLRLPKGECSNG